MPRHAALHFFLGHPMVRQGELDQVRKQACERLRVCVHAKCRFSHGPSVGQVATSSADISDIPCGTILTHDQAQKYKAHSFFNVVFFPQQNSIKPY